MRTLACFAVVALLASGASAAPLAYEGFDYTDGDSVSGQTGGDGWADAWDGTDQHNITSPGLTYTDSSSNVLPVKGNMATGVSDEDSFRSLDVTLWPSADKTGSELGAAGEDIWVSFIGQAADAEAKVYSGLALYNTSGDQEIFFGNTYNDEAPGKWGFAQEGGITTTTDVNVDEQRFVLARMTWADDKSDVDVDMWLNPQLDDEAGLASHPASEKTSGTVDNFTFNQVHMYGGSEDHDHYWDEIRFGTTYDQVVPEPATMALLALGGLGLIRRRRKA